jgi:predicted dehydrogenase
MPESNPLRWAICDASAARRAALAARDASVELCDNLDTLRELLRTRDAILVAEPCPPREVMESLFAAAREAGRQFAVVNPDRYLPSRQIVRKQLSGPLGDAGLVRIHRWEPPSNRTDDFPEPLPRDIDVTLWLVGRMPDRVFAVGQGDHYRQVHLGFANGAMALLDFCSGLPAGDGYQSLSVIAASGAAYADDHQNTQLLFRGGHPQAVFTQEHAAQLTAITQEFADTIRAGRDVTADNQAEWRNVFAVADAVRESLASRQAVSV